MRTLLSVLLCVVWMPQHGSGEGPILPSAEFRGSALQVPQYTPVALTLDGKLFALGGRSPGSVRLVEAATGQEVDQLRASRLALKRLQFSPDDQWLIGADSERVHVWSVRQRRLVASCPPLADGSGMQKLLAHAVSPDGSVLVTAVNVHTPGVGYHENANVQGWKLPGGEALWSKEHPVGQHTSSFHLAIAKAGKRIALWPDLAYTPEPVTEGVRFWEVNGSVGGGVTVTERERSWRSDRWRYWGLTFTPDGEEIVLGMKEPSRPPKPGVKRDATSVLNETGFLSRVRYDTLEEVKRWETKLINAASVLTVNPSGTLVAGYDDKGLSQFGVWDLRTGEVRALGKRDYKNWGDWPTLWEVRFNRQDQLQLAVEHRGQAMRWLVERWSGGESLKPPVLEAVGTRTHQASIESMAFLPGGRLRSIDSWGMLCTWDLKTNQVQGSKGIANLDGPGRHSAKGLMLTTAWSTLRPSLSPGGRYLVRSAAGATAQLTNLETGVSTRLEFGLDEEAQAGLSVDWSADARRLLTVWSERAQRTGQTVTGRKMRVWDTATGKALWTVDCPGYAAGWFTSDAKHIQVNGQLLDASSGKPERAWAEDKAYPRPVLSPDGRRAGLSDRGKLRIVDAETGTSIDEHTVPQRSGRQEFVGFRPDGRSILLHLWLNEPPAGVTSEVQWIELASWTPRATFAQEANARLYHPTMSPDGSILVATNDSYGIVRWDLPLSRPKGTLTGAELDREWKVMGEIPAGPAWQAMLALAGDPERSVPFLANHLKDNPLREAPQLLEDLDHADFARREAASRALAKLGKRVEGALREVAAAGSPERQRRAQQLLERLPAVDVVQVRLMRTVETLEMIATDAAQIVLRAIAAGSEADGVTREAKDALRRLAK